MNENKIRTKSRYIITFIIIFSMFFSGLVIGGTISNLKTSSDVSDLQNQLEILGQNTDINGYQNVFYYYNDSSLSDIYNTAKDSIVEITGIYSYQSFFSIQYTTVQGSGFVYNYNDDNYVITNNHVVDDTIDIVVTFDNGNSYPAEIIGSDPYADLAILVVNAPSDEFKPIDIVSSSNLNVGDPVIAIGNPLGLESTMTIGIVSQVGRTIEESIEGNYPLANIIQTSVAINPGNSGGPLLNYQG